MWRKVSQGRYEKERDSRGALREHFRFQRLPPRGIKSFGPNISDFIPEFEIKKVFVGEDINIKTIKWDPIGDHYSSSHYGRLGALRLVRKLRWTPEGECTGLVETSAAIKIESPTWHKILTKKACGRQLFWNTLLLAWFFKNTFPHKSFENEIQTLQLDIKFSNP